MASRGHSRFTDDIVSSPVPSAPKIQAKPLEAIRDEVFANTPYAADKDGLLEAEELKSKALYQSYPPQFRDMNKQFIFQLLNEGHAYSPSGDKSVLITRWQPFVLRIERPDVQTNVVFAPNSFDYQQDGSSPTVQWYLNFADNDLFAFYAGALLAQDELQVLECPELAALREYFVQATSKINPRTSGRSKNSNGVVPTPILISNTERLINLDSKNIYGNAFAKANHEVLRSAFHRLQPPQVVNLIAMQALSYGNGDYTVDEIRQILTTCYTGFKAAKMLDQKTHAMNNHARDRNTNEQRMSHKNATPLRTTVHTGWWGCGAFGNNRQMMLITQMVAARWAQIDEIIFHTQTDDHKDDIEKAKEAAAKLKDFRDVEKVLEELLSLKLRWEKSNNT